MTSLGEKIIEMCSNHDMEGWSDIHIHQESNLAYRNKNGDIVYDDFFVRESDIEVLLKESFSHGVREKLKEESGDVDFAFGIYDHRGGKTHRFRSNLFFFEGMKIGLVMRKINDKSVPIEELNLGDLARTFNKRSAGLVLVTGSTGSGKSTTLTSMIEEINNTINGTVVTVEDPIEYVYTSKKCRISQREIGKGKDSPSFQKALRASLRQDPDVILVGEIRDKETASICLEASQTGHLVFGTLHTKDAQSTISRYINMFDDADKDNARAILSDVLVGVISQVLVPMEGGGKIMACEVMSGNSSIRNLIRNKKDEQIYNGIASGFRETGMNTLNMSLIEHIKNGKITVESAMDYSVNLNEMEKSLSEAGISQSRKRKEKKFNENDNGSHGGMVSSDKKSFFGKKL